LTRLEDCHDKVLVEQLAILRKFDGFWMVIRFIICFLLLFIYLSLEIY